MIRTIATSRRAPLVALAIIALLSLGARALLLDEPCASPCTVAGDHTLIFDEAYYVNAARVIAGIRPPAGAHYNDAPLGTDPNAEHPQGVKLVMAAAIELFGDGPFAWRIGSLLMGTLAILGMFALVRGAGGGPWPAVTAAALMAADNLLLVHGRIGTLDIYGVAGMVWAVAAYLRGRPLLAGGLLALATAFKEVSPYALLVLALLELGRLVAVWRRGGGPPQWRWWPALRRWLGCAVVTAVGFVALLALMAQIGEPYADADGRLVGTSPFSEISHIVTYAKALTSPHGPRGIASYPWQWLLDLKPIVYLRINPSLPGHELGAIHPVTAFFGMMSPPIMLLALPALAFCAWRILRPGTRRRVSGPGGEIDVAILGLAWFVGTWVPFALQSLLDQRTSYIYYMVVVMPGIYVAVTYLLTAAWSARRRWLTALTIVWGASVLAAVVLMYPFVVAF